jgi:hypothetical protein
LIRNSGAGRSSSGVGESLGPTGSIVGVGGSEVCVAVGVLGGSGVKVEVIKGTGDPATFATCVSPCEQAKAPANNINQTMNNFFAAELEKVSLMTSQFFLSGA